MQQDEHVTVFFYLEDLSGQDTGMAYVSHITPHPAWVHLRFRNQLEEQQSPSSKGNRVSVCSARLLLPLGRSVETQKNGSPSDGGNAAQ